MDKRMKVLHVYKTYYPEDFTGVPRVIHAIAEGTAALGIESQVLSLTGGVANVHPVTVGRHQVHQVKRDFQLASADFAFSAFGTFRHLARTVDVINYHFPWPTADLLWITGGQKIPSVITYHSDIVRQRTLARLYAPLRTVFLNGAEKIVATSPNYLKSSEVLQKHKARSEVIPIGIEPRVAVDAESRRTWEDKIGKDFFLFVGAARYYKGIQFLIDAARMTGLPVVLAGDKGDITSGDLPNNVVTTGRISDRDREALLDLSLAFVFPSHLRSEAFGVALLEAARAGKPMISCEMGTGTSYVNVDGLTGIVVPPASPEHLAQAMWQLASSRDGTTAMGLRAAERYQALFTRERMAQSYSDLYQRVVGNRSARAIG